MTPLGAYLRTDDRIGGREGGEYLFVAGLDHLNIDHASISRRRSTVPTPNRDTFTSWALIALFSIHYKIVFCKAYLSPFLFRRMLPPPIA